MHSDNCETVIGKHWNEIGSIDWEGNYPVLDAKLRVVRVEFIDNIEADEDYMPVEIHNGHALRTSRRETDAIDAYMTPFSFGVSHGSLIAVHDLCENPETEEKIDLNFPLYAESGCIVSHFAIIERDFYFANREDIDEDLMELARDQADREYFAAADDCEAIGIALVEGRGLVATFDWNGEKVQSLVGMIDREPGEGDEFDPITDKADTEVLAARMGPRSPIDMDPARTLFVRVEGDHDLICDLLGNAVGTEIEAFEVVDTPRDSEAVRPEPSREPGDARDEIVDALADLRHKAHADGIDFDYALKLSLMHFNAER